MNLDALEMLCSSLILFPNKSNMLGAIAQFETEIRAERQMDGIKNAQKRGVEFGRKKILVPEQVEEMKQRRQSGTLIKTLMNDYHLSKASVYRYLKDD